MKLEPTQECLNKLFNKLDFKGIEDWLEVDQNEVCELMTEYQHVFALDDTELGCISLVKHKIGLDDPKPFKDRYRRILPNQFKEMIQVGAVHKSVSPWVSPIVLVQKKDGTLWFCIDLRKLNNRTVKDAYSLL